MSRQNLPGWLIQLGRIGREASLRLIDPLDYLVRVANGKLNFPPIYLRRYVGPLASFESSGAEFAAYLKLIARLAPQESLLDVGCGCGLVALALFRYLSSAGTYLGLDVHAPSIGWCQRSIQKHHTNFRFERVDVRNATYNPLGKHRAEEWVFPVADASFDVVLIKSVFTHMRPQEVANYLHEIARVLRPGGRCLATFFLFSDTRAMPIASNYQNRLTFQFGDEDWRYEYKHSPESAVAYSERFVLRTLAQQRLVMSETFPGTWRNGPSGVSFQDMLLLEKMPGPNGG